MKRSVLITAGVLLAVAIGNHHQQQQAKAKAEAARKAHQQQLIQQCVDRAGGERVWADYNPGDNPGYPTGWNSTRWQCTALVLRQGV